MYNEFHGISHPQMYLLYQDPEGKTIFEKGATTNGTSRLAANLASKVELEEMSERIAELEQLLSKVSNGVNYEHSHLRMLL